MDTETRAYLEGMEQRLAAKSDLSSVEGRLFSAIEQSQEALAPLVKRGFDDTGSQLREVRARLGAVAEAVDADCLRLEGRSQ